MPTNAVIHLIDDDEDVRRALAFLLGTAGFMVRVYDSALSFLEKFDSSQSGCIISDVRMPGMDGLELLRRLRERAVHWPVIVMTGHADVPMAVSAMKEGATDFIEKPFSDEVLLKAIDVGLRSRHPSDLGECARVQARVATLSQREKEVLDGLVAGHSNKVIGFQLGISPRTVEVHRANVMSKMAAGSLSELVRMALVLERH
jgi:two-component system response regulator FixJ